MNLARLQPSYEKAFACVCVYIYVYVCVYSRVESLWNYCIKCVKGKWVSFPLSHTLSRNPSIWYSVVQYRLELASVTPQSLFLWVSVQLDDRFSPSEVSL